METQEVYLNNAATGWPKAPGVIDSLVHASERMPSGGGRMASGSDATILRCRELVAQLLNVDNYSRIIMTTSATHALNLAIRGLGLGSNSHAVTSSIDHNSVLRPLYHLKDRHPDMRISVIGLDSNNRYDSDAFERALQDSPHAVILNHASNVTGRIYDVAALFAKAKAAGAVTVLDATQTVGAIPVSPVDLNADVLAFTGHKALHGPLGSGALYVAPHIDLDQVLVGGTGVRSDLTLHPSDMPVRLEAGTPNIPAIDGLSSAIDWTLSSMHDTAGRVSRLTGMLYEGLSAMPGVHVFDNDANAERVGIISFSLDNWSVEDAGMVLSDSYGIACRTGLHCAPLIHRDIGSLPEGTIRFSVSGFNTTGEIHKALDAVGTLAS